MRRIIPILLALVMLLASTACYPLRIAKNPNPQGQGQQDVYDPDDEQDDDPDVTEPAETEPAVTEPIETEAAPTEPEATEPAVSESAAPAVTETPAAETAAPDDTAAPSQTANVTAAPSQTASANTPAPSQTASSATPTPTAKPTPTPTPKPTPTPAPTPAPTPTPAQTGDFSEFSSAAINGYGTYTNAMFGNARVTMINFWATWCGPCIEELPDIQRLYNNYSGRAQIVTYLRDSSDSGAVDTALGIMNGLGITLPVIRCNSSVRKAFGAHANLEALPVTFFVDSSGHILRIVSGAQSYETYAGILNGML